MSSPITVLGINCAHDAAACVLRDGQFKMAIAEERLVRRKHQDQFPQLAVKYCLDSVGIKGINDVDCVVINEYEQTDFAYRVAKDGYQGMLLSNPSHHLLHAYYAWVASGFDEAAILIVDGSGYSYGGYKRRGSPALGDPPLFSEMEETESLYHARGNDVNVVDKRWGLWQASRPYYRFPSLGHMYSMASQYIFGDWVHAGKTMGLASFGDPNAWDRPIVTYTSSGLSVDTEWITDLPPRSKLPAHLDKTCCDIAAKVQQELENGLLYLARRLYERTACKNLCISGGVALNGIANYRIVREGPFSKVFVTPAASDSGVAIGAAFFGIHRLTNDCPRVSYTHDFHGRSYSETEISEVLRQCSLVKPELVHNSALEAARDIAGGKIVGWFEGGSEFGPRALGHRSILCDPRDKLVKKRLNETVKFREIFRPYAAAILREYCKDFFELDGDSPYMLLVAKVRDDKRYLIPGVCHVDHTCRIQTVPPDHLGNFRKLIEYFMELTGMPLVLNTSFNIRGEPVVETPEEAIECFLGSNFDVLYLQNYRITKVSIGDASEFKNLVPVLNGNLSLAAVLKSGGGKWGDTNAYVQTRTGHKIEVSLAEFEILKLVDAEKTIGQIWELVPEQTNCRELFSSLKQRGFVSFRIERGVQSAAADRNILINSSTRLGTVLSEQR
jgi:carbamoyltransferase